MRGRPPRQGDSDEGRVVLLDAPAHNRWPALLALGGALFGRSTGGRRCRAGRGQRAGRRPLPVGVRQVGRPADRRPSRFADAGLTILRTDPPDSPEIWCRCDGGPHGFLSIAAHAHADALSVEVRYDGVDILADPGTYCYHGEPEWRSYFRSTIGHNTVEIGGAQPVGARAARSCGRQARTRRSTFPDRRRLDRGARRILAALRPPACHRARCAWIGGPRSRSPT